MITQIVVNDAPLNLGMMPAQVTVLHGRDRVRGGPEASSATVLFLQEQGMPGWVNGDTIRIVGDTGPLFSGRIAEIGLTHGLREDRSTYGLFAVTCVGAVAALGYRSVGDEPWPAESAVARAERILQLAEVPYLIDGTIDARVLARDVDSRSALELLDELAKSTVAAVVDMPSGEVVYQPLSERARPVRPFRWQDFDPAFTWAGFDPAFMWSDFASMYSGDSEFPLAIPIAAVGFEPTWNVTADSVINHVRVGYGPNDAETGEQAYVDLVDQASIDRHGRRYNYESTMLEGPSDALDLASWVLSTDANPHWSLDEIAVHLDLLDEPTRAAVLALTCGDHVTVDQMPDPAPAIVAEAIVEGWTYVTWGQGGRLFERIMLRTSALLESLAVPTWSDHTPEHEWSDYSAALSWSDMTSLESIGA